MSRYLSPNPALFFVIIFFEGEFGLPNPRICRSGNINIRVHHQTVVKMKMLNCTLLWNLKRSIMKVNNFGQKHDT